MITTAEGYLRVQLKAETLAEIHEKLDDVTARGWKRAGGLTYCHEDGKTWWEITVEKSIPLDAPDGWATDPVYSPDNPLREYLIWVAIAIGIVTFFASVNFVVRIFE